MSQHFNSATKNADRIEQITEIFGVMEATPDTPTPSARRSLYNASHYEVCITRAYDDPDVTIFELYEDGDLVAASDRGELLDYLTQILLSVHDNTLSQSH